ncbi:hypothetical protein D3C72_2422010 [compost metagenome]
MSLKTSSKMVSGAGAGAFSAASAAARTSALQASWISSSHSGVHRPRLARKRWKRAMGSLERQGVTWSSVR